MVAVVCVVRGNSRPLLLSPCNTCGTVQYLLELRSMLARQQARTLRV